MNDINKINNEKWEKEKSHSFLGESILTPNANKTDCNRLQMFTSHIMQCVQIAKSEPPIVFTGFENQVGKYSTGYKYLKGNWTVLKKIYKNKFNYILIIQNEETGLYDIVYRKDANWLTEHFGYKNKNRVIDKLQEGDSVGNKVLYRNHNYDGAMNLSYGCNLNAIYLPFKGFTNEDAIVISESTAEKMSSYFVKKITINVNTNDLLINLYGDNDFYKTFPDIGEEIKDGILLARRRINYSTNIYNLKDLNEIKDEDDVTYFKGTVADIDVYSNCDIEKMKDQQYNKQVYHYLKRQREYYKQIIEFLNDIRKTNKEYEFSEDLLDEYNRCLKFFDPNTVLNSNGRNFDNYVIEFTVIHKKPLSIGSKLTGRYGNKGVVSLIIPDNEMPEIEEIDGDDFTDDVKCIKRRAEIVLNPSGIINRLNPSQLIEQEINFTSQIIRYRMSKMDNLDDKWNYLYEYVLSINEREAKEMKKFYNSLEDEAKEKFIQENIDNQIYINQEPFWNNINITDLGNIYRQFNINKYKLKDIVKTCIMGEMYFLRLKHDPSDKYSSRSTGYNNFKDLPTKSRTFKDSKTPYSDTPIRIGEMETTNLGLSGDNRPIKELLDSYANNTQMRQELVEGQLTTNPFKPEIDFSKNKDSNNNLKILNSFLAALGIEIINNNGESNIKHMYLDGYKKEDEEFSDDDYGNFIKSKLYGEDDDEVKEEINLDEDEDSLEDEDIIDNVDEDEE